MAEVTSTPLDSSPSTVNVGTSLLGGIAWLEQGQIYTAGKDGKIYRVDPDAQSLKAVSVNDGYKSQVRVLLGNGPRFLTADSAGKAFLWTDSSLPLRAFLSGDKVTPPVAYETEKVVFGRDTQMLTWNLHDLAGDPASIASLPEAGGRLDVLLKISSGTTFKRAAWTASDGMRVELFSLDAGTNKGAIQSPEKVLLVVASDASRSILLLCDSGTFRRHRFPEDVALANFTNARFPQTSTAHKFTRKDSGGWLVSAGADRKAYRLGIISSADASPEPSANEIHDGTGVLNVSAIAVAADGNRMVAILPSGTFSRGKVRHAQNLTEAWNDVPGLAHALRSSSLVVADNGLAAALVASNEGAAPDPVLYRMNFSGAAATVQTVVDDATPLPDDFYENTQHVAFMPDGGDSLLLLTQDGSDIRSLQKLTLNAEGKITATKTIHPGDSTAQLAAAPVTLKVAGTGTFIASAWADGKIRVHLLKDDDTLDPTVREANASQAAALALTPGTPPRLACFARNSGKGQVRIWNVADRLIELERFTPQGIAPAQSEPPLGWRGDAVVLGTLDGTTLRVEAFPLSFVDRYPIATDGGANLTAAAMAANVVAGDKSIVAVAGNDKNLVLVNVAAAGPPAKFANTIKTLADVRAVEFLSLNDLAVVQTDDKVFFFHSDGAAIPTFTSSLPLTDRKFQWLRGIDESRVLAGGTTIENLLTRPTTAAGQPTVEQPDRPVPGVSAPTIIVDASNVKRTVGFETITATGSTLYVSVRPVITVDAKVLPVAVAVPPASLPQGKPTTITAAAWNGESLLPVLGLGDGSLWAPDGANPYKVLPLPPTVPPTEQMVLAMARAPNKDVFALVLTLESKPNQVHLRNTSNPDTDTAILDAGGPPTSLAYSPSGTYLAAGTSTGTVHLFGATETNLDFTGEEVQGLAFWEDPIHAPRVRLAALTRRGRIKTWSLNSGTWTADTPGPAASVAPERRAYLTWSPDGSRLAIASQDGTLSILTVAVPVAP